VCIMFGPFKGLIFISIFVLLKFSIGYDTWFLNSAQYFTEYFLTYYWYIICSLAYFFKGKSKIYMSIVLIIISSLLHYMTHVTAGYLWWLDGKNNPFWLSLVSIFNGPHVLGPMIFTFVLLPVMFILLNKEESYGYNGEVLYKKHEVK
jgi:thiamine transporter ThiT